MKMTKGRESGKKEEERGREIRHP